MSSQHEERQKQGTYYDRQHDWHVDKSISVGHLISTVALAGALAGFVFSTNTKVELANMRMDGLEQRINREVARQADDMSSIRMSLQRLEDKIDRNRGRTNESER